MRIKRLIIYNKTEENSKFFLSLRDDESGKNISRKFTFNSNIKIIPKKVMAIKLK